MSAAYDAQNVVDLRIASSTGIFEDHKPILDFIRKDGLTTAIGNLGYYNTKNDIKNLLRQWIQLADIVGKILFLLEDEHALQTKLALVEQNERLVEFYMKLVANLRPAYNVFANREPVSVAAVLKLLSNLVQFHNRRVTAEFIDRFDFANAHFHQLFVPSRDCFDLKIVSDVSMRYAVVDFWLLLTRDVDFTLKKSLLTNFLVMNQFWKYLDMEKYERLNEIIDFLDSQVLGEINFKRSTKCRILNENALLSLCSLFALVTDTPRESDKNDMPEFRTFKSKFSAFMATMVSSRKHGLLFPVNEFGTPISINGMDFKINNKLLHKVLVFLKPWEHNSQLSLAMSILNSAPELVGPYMAWLVSNFGGYHDPLLSSYWVGRSLLFLEILKSTHIPFSYETVALLPLSKQALASCLAYPNDLIKQIALELVYTQLEKVQRSENRSVLLTESIVSNLPPLTSLAPFLTHENRIIKLTATSIVALLEQVAPKSSSLAILTIINQQVSSINLNTCTSYDLVLLDKYLTIQFNNELKWWNTSGTHSFFTSLLLLSRNAFLKAKAHTILCRLVKQSLSFSAHLVESPVSVLIDTLAKTEPTCLPKLLDETISRCLKSPYKYLDQSNINYDRISIFLVVLLEQLAYLRNNQLLDSKMEEWLRSFIRQMVLIGESQIGVQNLLTAFNFDYMPDFSKLRLKKRILSGVDFAEAVMFLNGLKKPSTELILDIFSRLGEYCMGLNASNLAISWLVDPATFRFFDFHDKIPDSSALAIALYNKLLKQLSAKLKDMSGLDLGKVASFLLKVLAVKQKTETQKVLTILLWLLQNKQLEKLVANFDNKLVVLKVYELYIERNVPFCPDLDHLLKIQSPRVGAVVMDMTFSTFDDVSKLYQEPKFHFVLCKEGKNAELFENYLLTVNINDSLLYQVAPLYPKVSAKFSERVAELAKSMENWHQSLRIFIKYPSGFNPAEIARLVFENENCTKKDSMTALFATFVSIYSVKEVQKEVDMWFSRAMLYVTRKFAECSSLSSHFYDFLDAVDTVIAKSPSLLHNVPLDMLQAQVEVVLTHDKWIRSKQSLKHICKVLQPTLNFDKLLQMFVTNEKMILYDLPEEREGSLRTDSAILLQKLFKGVKPAEGLLRQLVVFYNGTLTSEDLIIKEVLMDMEAKLMVSWIVHVNDWDFIDELKDDEVELVRRVKLITANKTSYTVTLSKDYIMNSIDGARGVYAGVLYDPEFLIQLILNNHELVSEIDGQLEFDLEGIIQSHVLRFIVASLSNPLVREHCIMFLQGMVQFLERITRAPETKTKDLSEQLEKELESKKSKKHWDAWNKDSSKQPKHRGMKAAKFRHKNLLKVYLASILHTVKVADHLIPLVWYMVASFLNILVNPGHFMYDRVKNYILSTPVIKTNGIPLFSAIMLFSRTGNDLGEDNYYRQVAWLVDQLACGVRNDQDLRLLLQKGVMERLFTFMTLAYLKEALKTLILRLVYQIQQVSLNGGEALVTRFGTLTSLEAMKHDTTCDGAISVLFKLNVDQLALRFGILAESLKRLREWTNDDLAPAVKRIHQQP